jgi:hypothetical protein
MFQIFRNLLRRQKSAPHQETFEGYLPYTKTDNFPLEWHRVISNSPSGQSCVSTIADFLEGVGFSNPDLDKLVVNSQLQTFFQIHQETCKSLAEFEGFAWHFMYNGAGQIAEIRVFPFESCRLGKADDRGIISKIYYNPFFGTTEYTINSSNRKCTQIYDTFNPTAVKDQIAKQGAKYKGQVLYVGSTTPLSRFYPMPEATSAIGWMKSEAGISDYHEDNINNGLLQPYMLIMKGDPNQPSTNPEYTNSNPPTTIGMEFSDMMDKDFMGAKRVGNVMVQWVNNPDEKPEVLALPTNANSDTFITVDNQATKKITVAFKVPAILANIQEGVSLGGDGNMIRVAVKLMQQRVIKKQRILTDTYEKVLKIFTNPWTEPIVISPYNPYPELEVLDDKIWSAMTEEEKRKWINDNSEIELLDTAEPEVTSPDQATQAKVLNAIPVGFPESIRRTVQKALDHDEKMALGCGKRAGKDVGKQIIENHSMGQRQLKRIYSYLKKRPELANTPLDSCESIMYHMWGGKEMETFLEAKIDQIDKWLN